MVISTQFNFNCIFRIDLIHLQQKSLQEYVKTITCTRILNSVRKLRVSNKQLRIKAVMGGSLGPVLANIILTEFEQVIIDPLINSGIIKFYCRYVDDTLLLIKRDDIDFLLHKFHSFDHNIRFTYDAFSDEPPHFLDLNLDGNRFSIYRKHTFTGQYTHFDSFVPWKHRTACLRSLLSRPIRSVHHLISNES